MDSAFVAGCSSPPPPAHCRRAIHEENDNMIDRAQRRRRTFTLILLTCLAVSLVCVAYPIYVIRPFRHQGARELALALGVTRFRPIITVITSLAALLALIGCWRAQPGK